MTPTAGRRKRIVLYGRTRRDVLAKLKAATERAESGAPVKDAAITVASWLARWRASTLKASGRKESTKSLYAYLCRSTSRLCRSARSRSTGCGRPTSRRS